MSVDIVVSQWGEAIDARLREHVPGLDIRSIARGTPAAWPAQPHILLAMPMKGDAAQGSAPPPADLGGLRWVQLASVGIDNYPRWLLDAPLVTTANGTSSEVIAEFALACILSANKGLPERWITDAAQWRHSAAPPLRGSVLGVVGLGGIGSALATKALALGMRVIALRRSSQRPAVEGVELVTDIEALLAATDHVVIAAPGTPQTRHLIGRDALRAAKPGLHLVNVARGSLVDQDALLDALNDGRIGRASLDVTEPEPLPAGHPFYSHPRVKLSPHTSAISPWQHDALIEKFVRNLARFRAHQVLEDVVDAARIARGY
jgi:phosphoglycerate dehydrogenase-like enzyme